MRTICINGVVWGGVLGAAFVPGTAQASTTGATGVAVFAVHHQCTVSGTNVDLGAYFATQLWSDVGGELGVTYDGTDFTPGAKGLEYLNFGSVTCDQGVPYTLGISGTSAAVSGAITLKVNDRFVTLLHAVKKLGDNVMTNSSPAPVGQVMPNGNTIAGTGTGMAQTVLGNVKLGFTYPGTTVGPADVLTTAGTYTDSLTYALNF